MDGPEQSRRGRWVRRLFKALVTLALLAGLLFAGLQTPPGRATLVALLGQLLAAKNPFTLQVAGIHGLLPFDFTVDRIALGDVQGEWLTISGVKAKGTPWSLLQGKLQYQELSVRQVMMARRPIKPKRYQMPKIPGLRFYPGIDAVRISHLELQEPVLGSKVALAVDGQLVWTGWGQAPGIQLAADNRPESQESHIKVSLERVGGAPTFSVEGVDGQLLPRWLQTDAPVQLGLHGNGSRSDWRGDISLSAGGQSILSGKVSILGEQPAGVDAVLAVDLARLGRAKTLKSITGETLNAKLRASLALDGLLTVQEMTVQSAHMQGDLTGAFQISGKQGDLSAHVNHEDLRLFHPQWAAVSDPLLVALTVEYHGTPDAWEASHIALVSGKPFLDGQWKGKGTTAGQYAGALHAQLDALALPGLDLVLPGQLACQITAERNTAGRWTLQQGHLEGKGLALEATGFYEAGNALGSLHATGDFDLPGLWMLVRPGLVCGPISGECGLDWRGDDKHFTGTARATTVQWLDWNAQDIKLAVDGQGGAAFPGDYQTNVDVGALAVTRQTQRWDRVNATGTLAYGAAGELVVDPVSVTLGDGAAKAQGKVRYEKAEARLALDGALDWTSMAALSKGLPEGVDAGGSARFSVAGQPARKIWNASLEGRLAGLRGTPEKLQSLVGDAPGFALDGVYENGLAGLSKGQISLPSGDLDITGTLNPGQGAFDLRVRADAPNLAVFEPVLGRKVEGRGLLDTGITGHRERLVIEGKLTLEKAAYSLWHSNSIETEFKLAKEKEVITGPVKSILRLEGVAPLTLNLDGAYDGKKWTGRKIRFAMGKNQGEGSLSYETAGKRMEGEGNLTLQDMGLLTRFTDSPITGRAKAKGTFSLGPGTNKISVTLDADDLAGRPGKIASISAAIDLGGKKSRDTLKVRLDAKDCQLGRLDLDHVGVDGSGTLDKCAISLTASGHTVLRAESPVLPLTLACSGSLAYANREIALQTATLDLGDTAMRLDAPTVLTMAGGKQALTPATLVLGDGKIRMDGAVGPGPALRASLSWNAVSLKALQPLTGLPMEGMAEGDCRIENSLSQPQTQLTAKFKGLRVGLGGRRESPLVDMAIDADYRDGKLHAAAKAASGDAMRLVIEGTLPATASIVPARWALDRQGPITGSCKGAMDLAALGSIMGWVDHVFQGHFDADLAMSGTAGSPVLKGDASLAGGKYENLKYGTVIRNLRLKASADGGTLKISEFAGEDGAGGSITGEGALRLSLSEKSELDAKIRLAGARVMRTDVLDAVMSGGLRLHGSLTEPTIDGQLTLDHANYDIPEVKTAQSAPVLEVQEINGPAPATEEKPDLEGMKLPLRLDIACVIPGKLFVRSPVLESEWKGELNIKGSAARPTYGGGVSVIRGNLDFFGRRLDLRESRLSFNENDPKKPYLNMRAAASTPDMSAVLTLSGELDATQLTVTSQPPLPEDEVLSRLLFRRNMSQISPVQAVQLARAASLLDRRFSSLQFLSGRLRLPGVDLFDIRTGEAVNSTVVGVGKYLNERVYIEAEQGGASNSGKVSAEVEVAPDVSVKADVGGQNRGGLGVFWRKDY